MTYIGAISTAEVFLTNKGTIPDLHLQLSGPTLHRKSPSLTTDYTLFYNGAIFNLQQKIPDLQQSNP